jgi:hypothetical protein
MLRSLEEDETMESLVEATEEAAQCWESLLFSTGGKLELSKCFFYLVYWVFNEEGEPSMLGPDAVTQQVQIIDSKTNLPIEIEIRPSNESHKTLGVMEAPDGD